MKMAAILLASGKSRRFGENKLLWKYQGKPLFLYVAEIIAACSEELLQKKMIVSCYSEVLEYHLVKEKFQRIENKEADKGISRSIFYGITCADDVDAYLFCVCDQPHLKKETIEGFITAYQKSGKGIGCLSYKGRKGNPVIFSRKYEKELLKLEGDIGGKRIMKEHLEDVFFYEIKEEKELEDIDYFIDIKKLSNG